MSSRLAAGFVLPTGILAAPVNEWDGRYVIWGIGAIDQ
jgi:hypothetical protein